jgi:hypothetical protein
MTTKEAEEALWHPARLIPTTGIRGAEEQERRATSALLAVMQGVPEFGRSLLSILRRPDRPVPDAPAGRISTYTEVQLKDPEGRVSIPDGAIVVSRGKVHWRCLVEVKTGDMLLEAEQVNRYLDMARAHDFQAVLTISNQIATSPTESPIAVDGRRIRRTPLFHISWWRILTEARVQNEHRGVSDPDQAWILSELIAYLAHPQSGASGLTDMGDAWTGVRDGARQGSLKASDRGVREIAGRWDQLVQYIALAMSQDLGRSVRPLWPKGQESAAARADASAHALAEHGLLTASLRIPDAAVPLDVQADLRTRLVTTAVEMAAPREGRAKTRIGWLLRQLGEAPPTARVAARYPNTRETMSCLVREAIERPDRLLLSWDVRREPKSFRISVSSDMGLKRGRGVGTFIDSTEGQAFAFYRTVVQNLRAWRPSAPKLAEVPAVVAPPMPLESTSEPLQPSEEVASDEEASALYLTEDVGSDL